MGLFDDVQKKSGLFSNVGAAETPRLSITQPTSMGVNKSTPYMTSYGTSDLLKDAWSFTKNVFVGGDDTAGGIFRNTVLGLPQAAKDVFFPTRGFTDEEIKNAKPTFEEKVTALPRYAAEFTSSIGNLAGELFTDQLYGVSQTKTGSLFADVGAELEKLGKPKTPGEAQTMRIGDVVNVLPVGSIKISGTTAEAIARSKNASDIFRLIKGELPNLADNTAEQYSKILTNIDDADKVQRILNKTEFALSGGKDVTETRNLSILGEGNPSDILGSKRYQIQKTADAERFMKTQATSPSGFNLGGAVSAEERALALERSKQIIKDLNNSPMADLLSEARKYKSAEEFVKAKSPALDYLENIKNDNNYKITKAVTGNDESRGLARIFQQRIDEGKVPKNVLDDFYSKTGSVIDMEAGYPISPMNGVRASHIDNFLDNPQVSQLTDIWNKANGIKTQEIPGIGSVKIDDSIIVSDDIIPVENQEIADIDWTDNFADDFASINTKVDELSRQLKATSSKEKATLESKIDDLIKKGAQLENDFLTKWRGKPQSEIRAKLDELDLTEYNLDMQEEYLLDHPINQLRKYEAKSGDYKGELPEVVGYGKSRFAREGDQFADELGMTSEEARAKYNEIKIKRAELKGARYSIREERKALKGILREIKSQGKVSGEGTLGPSRPVSAQEPQFEGEAKSLEQVAQEMLGETNLENIGGSSSLPNIVQQSQIPVEKKVNILDYLRTPEKVLRKIGLGDEADFLRKQYEKYLAELPGNIDKITEWSKRVPAESNEKIFDWLDGKGGVLSTEELAVGNEIKSWLAQWADRLDLPEDNRISYYITHLFDPELIKKEFDQDLAKIIESKIAGEVYDPFLQKRLGKLGYKRDTWAALDAYVKRATRKVHMDPALEQMKNRAPSLELSQWKYVKRYIDEVNMRPTDIDNLIDNGLKSVFGYRFGLRPTTAVLATLRRMTYRAMLGLNVGSALRNLSQGANTYAKLGEKYTTIGYAKLLSSSARAEIEKSGILAQQFVQDRKLSATKKAMEKIDRGLFFFFETAEKINRGAAYLGAKSKAIAEGKSEKEAIEYAKQIVRDTQFTFGSIDTPVGMGSDIVKSLVQFQTFTTKQIEFLAEMAKNKDFLGLLRYGVAGLAFVYTIGKAFGMEEKDLIPTYRFGVPASMKFPWEVGKAIINAPDKYGNPRNMSEKARDIMRTLGGLIPAGVQAKKTLEGVQAMQQGKATNSAGTPLYDVGGSTSKNAQAIIFGKYVGQGARDYYDNEMSYAESRYEMLTRSKTPKADFDKIIKEDPNLARNILKVKEKKDLGITKDDEKILNMNNGPRAQHIYREFEKLKTKEEKAALWEEYAKKKIITKDVAQKLDYLFKNPPPKESKIKDFLNALFGVKTASASELPDVWIRDNRINTKDIEEATAILFGEISNRSSDKQILEAQTILNTAFNRMDQYRARGMEKTLTEVLQAPNQYQAYKEKQYNKYKSGKLDSLDQRKIDSISKVIAQLYDGSFQNNIGDYVFYKHMPDGRIIASPGKLFK